MVTRTQQDAAYAAFLASNPEIQSRQRASTGDNEGFVAGGTDRYYNLNGREIPIGEDGRYKFSSEDDYGSGGGSQYTTGWGSTDGSALDWRKADRPESGGWLAQGDNALWITVAGVLAMAGGAAYLTAAESAAVSSGAAGAAPQAAAVGYSGESAIGAGMTGAEVGGPIAESTVARSALEPLAGESAATAPQRIEVNGVGNELGAPSSSVSGNVPPLAQTVAGGVAAGATNAALQPSADNGWRSGEELPAGNNGSGTDTTSGLTGIPWLDRILGNVGSGLTSGSGLGSLLTSLYDTNRRNQYAENLMGLYKPYNEQAKFYGDTLRQSYENPSSYFNGAEYQGIQRTVGDQLQRNDAAGGRLANDFGRQAKLQDLASGQIQNYRSGLAGIYNNTAAIGTGQGARSAYDAQLNANNGLAGTIGNIVGGRYNG